MMMIMIVLMGWDYVTELWPPTGLLFISQVINENGEPWWNYVSGGKLVFVRQSSGNPTIRDI
jgi:hypothetical protein